MTAAAPPADRWSWWRVVVGAVVLPVAVLTLGGLLWLAGVALRPVIGPDGPLAGGGTGVAVAVTVVLVGAVVALAATRRRWATPALRDVLLGDRPPDLGHATGDVAPPVGRRTGLAQALVGLAGALAVVSPFAAAPGDDRWVGAFDAPYSAWLGWRVAEAVRGGTWVPTTIPDALWPAGVDLLVTDGVLPTAVVALGNLVGLGPYAAYDVALLAGVGLNVWAGRRLGLVLTDRSWVALAGGLAFAAAPAVAAPVQAHIAFVWAFPLPLLVRRAVLDARGPAPVAWAPLAGLSVLAFACSAYHLVFGLGAYLLVALLWPGSAVRRAPALARVAAAGAVAALVLAPFLAARWSFDRDEQAAGATDTVRVADAFLLSADGLAAVTPPDELAVDLPAPDPSLGPEAFAALRIAFPGLALLAGGGVALAVGRRGAGALVGAAGVLWLLSLGPGLRLAGTHAADGAIVSSTAWLPFRLLLDVPGLAGLRAPYRATFAACAVLAGALVLGVDAVVTRARAAAADRAAARGRAPAGARRRADGAVAAVVAVVLALGVLGPLPTSDLGLTDPARSALEEVDRRGGPGEAVVVVPFGCRLDDPRIVALQIVHGQPSLGCSTSRAATPFASGLDAWARADGLRSLWCGDPAAGQVWDDRTGVPAPLDAAALDDLRADLGVRFVILDRGAVDPARCPWVPEGLALLVAEGEVLGDDGGWLVLDLGPVPTA